MGRKKSGSYKDEINSLPPMERIKVISALMLGTIDDSTNFDLKLKLKNAQNEIRKVWLEIIHSSSDDDIHKMTHCVNTINESKMFCLVTNKDIDEYWKGLGDGV